MKKALRTRLQSERNSLPKGQKKDYDLKINQALKSLILEQKYQKVHTYLPMGTEIDLYPLIKELLTKNIDVYTPKTLKNRQLEHLQLHSLDALEAGLWGTKHPKDSKSYEGAFDLIIVPGLAFDLEHNRLGYGGGYYDNFLRQHQPAHKIAVAYPFQLVQNVPVEAHDEQVDQVLYDVF